MKNTTILCCLAPALLLASCNSATTENDKSSAVDSSKTMTGAPAQQDLSQIRTEIQSVENEWAAAQNAKDITKLMALYADDAVSMPDGEPTLSGKAAIRAKQEKDFAAPLKYASVAFETSDVYGQADYVTEVGKTMMKDSAGKVTGTGKYIAVFQKKDGKYLCIREIYNKDSK